MNWLLDTNVISELRKPRPSEAVLNWYNTLAAEQLHTSTVNIAELVYGAEVQKDIIKRKQLLVWIDEDVRVLLAGRIHELFGFGTSQSQDRTWIWKSIVRSLLTSAFPVCKPIGENGELDARSLFEKTVFSHDTIGNGQSEIGNLAFVARH